LGSSEGAEAEAMERWATGDTVLRDLANLLSILVCLVVWFGLKIDFEFSAKIERVPFILK